MHPAKSVILFTTASGAGYGLIILAALFDLIGLFDRDPLATLVVAGIAIGLIVTGLLASTFHLGHPERAWRALTQWRTSWLSREGVAALWTFAPITGWLGLRYMSADQPLAQPHALEEPLALLAAISAIGTLYCTGMIYASLKAVPIWASRWTPLNYITLGLATGAILFNAIAHILDFYHHLIGDISAPLILIALVCKMIYWRRAQNLKTSSTSATATGLGKTVEGEEGSVSLLEAPHTESNYLMREMGFQIARKHAGRLRRIALVWTFIFPMIAIWVAGASSGPFIYGLVGLSIVTAAVGIVAERFLFFAEAKHVQTLFYGEKAV